MRTPTLDHVRTRLLVRLSNDDSSMKTISFGLYCVISIRKAARFSQFLSFAAFVTFFKVYPEVCRAREMVDSQTSML
ncbi:hypothetical protein M408DRAFT_293623 [Serendipita vermifera MAFF 305830]|uniref:Uncharacterized protein n=1 Tax=Serendipita vermifera MAFF 305830 TaxID=933852 RepID=A0A0C2WXU9_SERVB|nr:hypothetical protein M408DRAFT_299029 [Serendipita vermifera MAFF 305830]KIM22127.1 hypothetical protein M408DRAFT_293623 [Serendipita vermifera MAFF 305830]